MRRALLLTLTLTACASGYEPLVCDEAAADRVVFGYHVSDAFFSQYLPHGMELLLIDGSSMVG